MKNKFVFICSILITSNLTAQNGVLDSSFRLNGLIKELSITANSICVDKNNKTLVLGHDNTTGGYNIFVRRYLQNGTVDSSFASNGVFVNDINNDRDYGRCIVPLSSGQYILSGQNSVGPYFRTFIMKLNNNGTIDTKFGKNGFVIIEDNSGNSDAWNLEVSKTGTIYVAGYKTVSGSMKNVVWKLKGNDRLDSSFANNGEKIISTNIYNERLFDISISNNTIGVAGYSHNGSIGEGIVAVLDSNGNLNTGFNSVGYKKVKFNNKETYLRGVEFLSNGRLVTCGAYLNNGNYVGLLAVCTTNGALDNSFSGDGFYDDPAKISFFSALLVDCKDNVYAAGNYKNNQSYIDIYLKKIKPTGMADSSFAKNSIFTTRFNSNNDEGIETVSFSGKTKIVFAGRILGDAGSSYSGIGRILIPDCSNSNSLDKSENIGKRISIYPNPVSKGGTINVGINSADMESNFKVELLGLDGKNIQGSNSVNGNQFGLSTLNLASGIYILKITNGHNSIYQRIIVE